jgi:hypothetical protein
MFTSPWIFILFYANPRDFDDFIIFAARVFSRGVILHFDTRISAPEEADYGFKAAAPELRKSGLQ